MRILAFDTALDACSAAVWEDGRVLAHASVAAARGHAEILFPMLGRILDEAGLTYGDIDRFAATVGPGSFTGVRVGLAAARGLALGRGKPAVGVTTLEAIAATAARDFALPVGARIAVAIDARRGELYVQIFDVAETALTPVTVPEIVAHGDIPARFTAPMIVVGSGGEIVKSATGGRKGLDCRPEPARADPAVIAALAAALDVTADQPPPSPLYLRAPDAKLPGGIDPALTPKAASGRP